MGEYQLVDSGEGRKLERFGEVLVDRPAAQAVWRPRLGREEWAKCDLYFTREGDEGWEGKRREWVVEEEGIRFKLLPTDFGHLGIFPEQALTWKWIREHVREGMEVLNLFAYSGGSTLAAAQGGAKVCHLDASKGMVGWARENAVLNGLEEAPIRWIIDDVFKFLKREVKRGRRYDAIILDPPSFGRGPKGEVFKIEEQINPLLDLCLDLLSDQPKFICLSCHSPGFSPIVMHHVMKQMMEEGTVAAGEMVLEGEVPLPSGVFTRWSCE